MDYLTEEQKASFAATNALLGLGPTDLTAEPALSGRSSLSEESTMIMSSNADESHFTPHLVEVGSIADLRALAGLPEQNTMSRGGDTNEPYYPPPPTEEELQQVTGARGVASDLKFQPEDEDLQQRIAQAANAYVMGDPQKVAEYEPLINAAMFPGQVAAFTGDTLEIPAGATHVISGSDPVVLNYGQIIVGEGATIVVQTETMINSQIFIQQ
jgi:hypothetical protein